MINIIDTDKLKADHPFLKKILDEHNLWDNMVRGNITSGEWIMVTEITAKYLDLIEYKSKK